MKTNYSIVRFLLTVVPVVLFTAIMPNKGTCGERTNTAGISMGRVFVAGSRGLEAIGTNPANLTLPHREARREIMTETIEYDSTVTTKDSLGNDTTYIIRCSRDSSWIVTHEPPTASLSIPALSWGESFGSDFINYDIYKKYFTGEDLDGDGTMEAKFLSDQDKNEILALFPSGISETHFDFDLRIIGFTFHNDWLGDIGFNMTEKVAVNFDIPKDYVRFFFFGFDSLGSTYDFAGTDVRGWHLREYALSYARRLPMLSYPHFTNVSAGLGLKIVHGYEAAITDHYDATFSNRPNPNGGWDLVGNFNSRILRSTSFDPDNDNEEYNPIGSPAGTGFGIDFGVTADVYEAIRAGFSITDIGSITWTKNTKEAIGAGSFVMSNPTRQEQFDSLKDAFAGKDTVTGEFSIALPTVMRIGAEVQVDQLPFIRSFPGQLTLGFEYHQGFNNSPGNTTRARFALGAEYRPARWIPIRTGFSAGGIDGFAWAAGFGLDFNGFSWNFGTENIGFLFSSKNWDQVSFGTSMIVRM